VGPAVVVPAALLMLKEISRLTLVLVGDEGVLQQELAAHDAKANPRLRLHHASQKVEMDDKPSLALRGKKDSSMRVAINLVKSGEAPRHLQRPAGHERADPHARPGRQCGYQCRKPA